MSIQVLVLLLECCIPVLSKSQTDNIDFFLQVAIEKTHAAVMQIRERSCQLSNHYSPEQVSEIENNVTKRWEKLVTCAEERY